jgi:heterodisulfide reductase subunit C2
MTNHQNTVIDLDNIDYRFKHDVAAHHGGEAVKRCFACGACSARCPVGEHHPDFDPRGLIRRIILGLKQEVLNNPVLWLCSTCFTCQETCPQGVGFTEVMFALKNMATEEGHFPPAMKAQVSLLKDHGRLYEMGEFENRKRTELGLPELIEAPDHFRVILHDFNLATKEGD